jgi:phosphoserine phosphatase RsbU/P
MADEQPRAGASPRSGAADPSAAAVPARRCLTRVTSPARLGQVLRTRLLDTEPEEAFDRFARLAATILGQVTALTVADDRRSSWKACVTASGGSLDARENTVEESFCQYVIGTDRPLIVSDARISSAHPQQPVGGVDGCGRVGRLPGPHP